MEQFQEIFKRNCERITAQLSRIQNSACSSSVRTYKAKYGLKTPLRAFFAHLGYLDKNSLRMHYHSYTV
jgi:hypothetical protein